MSQVADPLRDLIASRFQAAPAQQAPASEGDDPLKSLISERFQGGKGTNEDPAIPMISEAQWPLNDDLGQDYRDPGAAPPMVGIPKNQGPMLDLDPSHFQPKTTIGPSVTMDLSGNGPVDPTFRDQQRLKEARFNQTLSDVKAGQQAGVLGRTGAGIVEGLTSAADSSVDAWGNLIRASGTNLPGAKWSAGDVMRQGLEAIGAAEPKTQAEYRKIAEQAKGPEQVVAGLASMPVSLLHPAAVASMLLMKTPVFAGATATARLMAALEPSLVELETALGLRMAPELASKFTNLVRGQIQAGTGLGGFSGVQATLEGDDPQQIATKAAGGALAGMALEAPLGLAKLAGKGRGSAPAAPEAVRPVEEPPRAREAQEPPQAAPEPAPVFPVEQSPPEAPKAAETVQAPAESSPVSEPESPDYSALSRRDLILEAGKRGLPRNGTAEELRARLAEDDAKGDTKAPNSDTTRPIGDTTQPNGETKGPVLETMTRGQLVREARRQKLPAGGSAEELRARLTDATEAQGRAAAPADITALPESDKIAETPTPSDVDALRQKAANILVEKRDFLPAEAAEHAATLGGEKELRAFIKSFEPEKPPTEKGVPSDVKGEPIPPKPPHRMTTQELLQEVKDAPFEIDDTPTDRKGLIQTVKAIREHREDQKTAKASTTRNPSDDTHGQAVARSLIGDAGQSHLASIGKVTDAIKGITANLGETGARLKNRAKGVELPNLSASSQEVADAAVRHASARIAAPHIAKSLISQVLGEDHKNDALAAKVGAVLTQDNLDSIRKAAESPASVRTLIGTDGYFKTQAEYDAALADPKVKAAVAKWKSVVNPWMDEQYRVQKVLDADADLPSRGEQTGARINLLAIRDEGGEPMSKKPVPSGPAAPRLSSTLKQKSPFERRATGTAKVYDVNLHNILENTVGKQLSNATKVKFYDALEESGDAVKQASGAPPKVKGEETFGIDLKRSTIIADGTVIPKNETLWVRNSLRSEVEGVLGLRRGFDLGAAKKVGTALNWVQMKGIVDFTSHISNLFSRIAAAAGGENVLRDALRVGAPGRIIDAVARSVQAGVELLQDSPATRKRLAYLAENGMLRGGEHGGLMAVIDSAGRLALDRMYTNLVSRDLMPDTVAGRRQFVNKVGQYNSRLQGPLMNVLKQWGVSPFVVAGKAFNRAGIEALIGSPGAPTTGPKAAMYIRVTQILNVAVSGVVLPVALNSLRGLPAWGRPGVPVGAIDLGTDNKDGSPEYFDPLKLLGIRRGMRVVGLNKALNDLKAGVDRGNVIDDALAETINTATHPYAGPAVQFGVRAATGGDLSLPPRRQAEAAGPGRSDFWKKLLYATEKTNPMVEKGIEGGKEGGATGAAKGALSSLGQTVGLGASKEVRPEAVRGADVKDWRESMIRTAAKRFPVGKDLTSEQKAKARRERIAYVRGEIAKQNLSPAEKLRAMEDALSRFKHND